MVGLTYYGNLCTQIYDLDKPEAPPDELAFYMSYAHSHDMTILEPMCGSGRFLVPFWEAGYRVDGFDAPADMLAACRRKCDARGFTPTLECCRLEDYESENRRDLIMLSAGSFSLLSTPGAVAAGARSLAGLLKDGGILLLEVLTLAGRGPECSEWRESNRKVREDGKVIVQYSRSHYDERSQVVSSPLKYELMDGDTVLAEEPMDFDMQLYDPAVFEATIRGLGIGFSSVRLVKAYDRREVPGEGDDAVVLECRR